MTTTIRPSPADAFPTELVGRVALVTGAGSGLGAATARVLAEAGMSVVCSDSRLDAARQSAAELRALGHAASAEHLDVLDADGAAAMVTDLAERHGRLDLLVNNAGVDRTAGVDELTLEDWDRVIGVNLRGPFVLSRAVLPIMRAQRSGHIVNVVSTAAKRAWPNASAYHASKWGLLGFSHALHTEARPLGVKVTAVVAGGMRTPFLLDRFPDIDLDTLQDPLRVAEAIRFVVTQPAGTVIPELMVLPMGETSWP